MIDFIVVDFVLFFILVEGEVNVVCFERFILLLVVGLVFWMNLVLFFLLIVVFVFVIILFLNKVFIFLVVVIFGVMLVVGILIDIFFEGM